MSDLDVFIANFKKLGPIWTQQQPNEREMLYKCLSQVMDDRDTGQSFFLTTLNSDASYEKIIYEVHPNFDLTQHSCVFIQKRIVYSKIVPRPDKVERGPLIPSAIVPPLLEALNNHANANPNKGQAVLDLFKEE